MAAPACRHEHLRFEDGTQHVVCIDCGRPWVALTHKGGPVDFSLRSVPMLPPHETRHDRWVMPRTQPLPKKV